MGSRRMRGSSDEGVCCIVAVWLMVSAGKGVLSNVVESTKQRDARRSRSILPPEMTLIRAALPAIIETRVTLVCCKRWGCLRELQVPGSLTRLLQRLHIDGTRLGGKV